MAIQRTTQRVEIPTVIESPWITHQTKEIYRNPWLMLREDAVTRPDGRAGIYGVLDTRIATGCVAMTPDQQVWLCGQWRYPLNQYSWEIIEGGAEEGELPLTAIQRELQEEGGLKAEKWEELGAPVHLSNCISSEVAHLYLAEDLSPVPAHPDGTEQLDVRLVPLWQCIEMVEGGLITDAMSVIAIYRTLHLVALREKQAGDGV